MGVAASVAWNSFHSAVASAGAGVEGVKVRAEGGEHGGQQHVQPVEVEAEPSSRRNCRRLPPPQVITLS
eukprot:CAMPEP_0197550122 /NCGR_PEP_ID=MMETSP1320-20131121/3824_1 /TAXON_ID=91990 /ORGANISM="Bolidomonas sp., Strain RCC2347" /LENGTH=68 /DNA_ID=CAMNT_0043110449 /DNA_START=365 /DNA_END=571 /DNA_ORIENTATION=+